MTGAFYRCFWALPFLWALVVWEERRLGPRPRALRRAAWIGGAFFAADLILWHYAIEKVGAGLATVLGNTQVVLVGLLAWVLFRERLSRNALLAIPIAMAGIFLISGVLEDGAYGSDPKLGAIFGLLTGIAYSGFLLALRRGSGERGRVAGPLFDATLATAVFVVPAGLILGDLDFTPSLEATLWLLALALSSQVVGWLLITVSLGGCPRRGPPCSSRSSRCSPCSSPLCSSTNDPRRCSSSVPRSSSPACSSPRSDGGSRRRSRPCPSIRHSFGTVGVGPRA